MPLDKFYQRKGHTPSSYCVVCSKILYKEKARKNGVKPKRYIIANANGEYQCKDCMKWKPKSLFKLKTNGKPQSYCKKCFNIRQKICRKKRNFLS